MREGPQLEIVRYSVDLRSIAQGSGMFTRSYLWHEPLPTRVAARLDGR